MTRGGAVKNRDVPVRRCIASGASGETGRMIRFVLDPDGKLTPDLAERLPGRGAWLTASTAAVALAVKKRLFSRAFRRPVEVQEMLADQLEDLLVARMVDAVGLARKAGLAVNGFEKVRARLRQSGSGAVMAASDGAADGRGKIAALAGDTPLIESLTSAELGSAFGRDSVIHAVLDKGGVTERVLREADRLDGFRQSR